MKLFVTGAGGFLGRYIVREALARGHCVVAMVRREPPAGHFGTAGLDRLRVIKGDLLERGDWGSSVLESDAVVHLAMGTGVFAEQFAGTVVGTESLLAVMRQQNSIPTILASTFSIYDYEAIRSNETLDENTPLELRPLRRDPYVQTKLLQEELVRDHHEAGSPVVILRPGAIYGPGHSWNGGCAFSIAGRGVAIAPRGVLKLTYVENCANAFVLAAESRAVWGETLNIVDDDLPTPHQFVRALRKHGYPFKREIPLPYGAAAGAALIVQLGNRLIAGGRAKVPAILNPSRLAAQSKPLKYSNARAKRALHWFPTYSLDEALARCRSGASAP